MSNPNLHNNEGDWQTPLSPPIPMGSFPPLVAQKRCCTCQADVTHTRRTLDQQGRYFCSDCWRKRVQAGTAIELVPAGSPRAAAAEHAFIQAINQNALRHSSRAGNTAANPIVVYVSPTPVAPEERGKEAFYQGFYATAGIVTALAVLAIGAVIFFAIETAWQNHQANLPAQPQATSIAQGH